MDVVVWVREGVWEAAIDAARTVAGDDARFTLVHVMSGDAAAAMSAGLGGLLGRRHSSSSHLHDVAAEADHELLAAAAERLDRPSARHTLEGRVEHEVVRAAENADLLVVSRDGDRRRLGPHSLGPATRFVVDHAPCPVLLVWPEAAPPLSKSPLSDPHPPPPPPPHRPH